MNVKEFFAREKIEYYSAIPLSECRVTRPYKLGGGTGKMCVVMILAPYFHGDFPENMSEYAAYPDYHVYFEELFSRFEAEFGRENITFGFSDNSPIDEVGAAAKCGLGVIGDNGLLINEKYSSFVFLGEIITEKEPEELGLSYKDAYEIKTCPHCGACGRACPSGCIGGGRQTCVSALTQKKGELTQSEALIIAEQNTAWGCDMCQKVCPYTKHAAKTPIKFFLDSYIGTLSAEYINSLDDAEFAKTPFAWRGRKTVLRNLEILASLKGADNE